MKEANEKQNQMQKKNEKKKLNIFMRRKRDIFRNEYKETSF